MKDFYFDDLNWAVRYLVADTSSWLPGRQVLISPYALELTELGKLSVRNLTRKQVESSPLLKSDQPPSQGYEEAYHQYYAWPFYRCGRALWGRSGFPGSSLTSATELLPDELIRSAREQPPERAEPQVLRTQVIKSYTVRTCDGVKGHLCDFLIDDKDWAIRRLVVKTGRRFSGQEIEIPPKAVDRISNEESTVFVHLTRAALEQSPKHPCPK